MADPREDEVTYYFKLAVEQYAEMSLVFMLDMCPYSRINALCVGVKNGFFIARVLMEEVNSQPLIWGSDVNGYFTVRDEHIVHCHFKSKLVRLNNAPPDALFMAFPLPANIDHEQRRFSRRVNLDEDTEHKLKVWHSYMFGGDFETPPQMRWESLKNRNCELVELSANGMRLELEEKNPLFPKLSVADNVLLLGDFGSPSKPAPLYILGNIVRKMPKPDVEGVMCIGCHFNSWRKVPGDGTWFRADPQEGIGQVAQWISRNFRNLNT